MNEVLNGGVKFALFSANTVNIMKTPEKSLYIAAKEYVDVYNDYMFALMYAEKPDAERIEMHLEIKEQTLLNLTCQIHLCGNGDNQNV